MLVSHFSSAMSRTSALPPWSLSLPLTERFGQGMDQPAETKPRAGLARPANPKISPRESEPMVAADHLSPRPVPEEDNSKRRQILDGARKVFMDLGFDGASMGEIARAAGVSKGTLYVYFTDKCALFEAMVEER